MRVLREEMVLDKTKASAVERIVNINFVNCDLTDVSIILRMSKLEIAALSVNAITSLEVFSGCTKLQQLYLRSNKIEDINEVEHLKNLLDLKVLALEANPCVERAGPGYRGILLRTLPTLHKIDRIDVTQEEVTNALRNSHPPVMYDEHNEETLNPFEAYQQSASQTRRSVSPLLEEQLVQVSPRTRTPFPAVHLKQELPPEGTRSMCLGLEHSRSCDSPADSCLVSREDYRELGPARMASIASVDPVRDYSGQTLEFGPHGTDFNDWELIQQQQLQQLKLQQLQLQLQMRQHQLPHQSYAQQMEILPQQSHRRYAAPGQRNAHSVTVAATQWQSGDCDCWQYSSEKYADMELPQPQPLMCSYPSEDYNMHRRAQQPMQNNILAATIYLLQELDLAAVQEVNAAVSKRLRDLRRE